VKVYLSVIDNVTASNTGGKVVMNMSLGGSQSRAINRAIQAMFEAGIVPVVAAGNENVSVSSFFFFFQLFFLVLFLFSLSDGLFSGRHGPHSGCQTLNDCGRVC
jgi:subtilisin family serine protease